MGFSTCTYKGDHISTVTSPTIAPSLTEKHSYSILILLVSNANYCIFMNFNENIING